MTPTHLYTYKIHWPFYERCFTSIVNLIFDIKLTFMKWIAVFIQYYVYVENALNYFIKKYLKIIIFLQDVPSKRSVLINISLDGIKVCCPKGQVIGICLKQPDLLKIFELFFRTFLQYLNRYLFMFWLNRHLPIKQALNSKQSAKG